MAKWRRASVIQCRRCGAFVVQGYDHDVAALLVQVNATPVTTHQELILARHGIVCYTLHMGELNARSIHATGKPPTTGTLHATHICK